MSLLLVWVVGNQAVVVFKRNVLSVSAHVTAYRMQMHCSRSLKSVT